MLHQAFLNRYCNERVRPSTCATGAAWSASCGDSTRNSRRPTIMRTFPRTRTLASTFFFALAISALILCSSLLAFGQATTGNIKGTVSDPSNALVSGATVTAKNQGTGSEATFTTTGEGFFNITSLVPG